MRNDGALLIVSCPDRHVIVASLSTCLAEAGANIVNSDQHSTDPEGGSFFLRMEFHLDGLDHARNALESSIGSIAEEFGMEWSLRPPERASASRCSCHGKTTACSTCSGAGGAASSAWTSSRSCRTIAISSST